MQDDQILQLEDMPSGTTPQDVVQEPEETAQAQQQAPVETEQARNFRQLKEARDREEQARRKAERERDELIRYMQSQQQPTQQSQEPDDFNIGSEDLAEGKHVKRVYNEVKELKKQLKQYQQQSAETIAEAKLKAAYPDADTVLSQENIDDFGRKHPELANTIFNSAGDSYSKMVSAYTMIKQLGVYQQPDLYTAEKQLAQRNSAKPRPLTSISPQQGDTPLSRANAFAEGSELTDELKKQMHKEMMKYRQGYL